MATFKYISKDMSAKTIRGTLEADDRNDLVRKLKEQNLFLVSCQDVTKKTVNQYKMKLNELSAYSREIGTMLASGLSLIRIFSIMVRREDNKKIKKIYENIYVKLQQGYTLSAAMEAQGVAFPNLMIQMYRSGEASGNMDKTALTMSDQYSKDHRIKGKTKSAMMYPIILIIVTIAVLLIVYLAVLPSFFDIFQNVELPLITKINISISKFLQDYWYIVLLIAAGLVVTFIALLRVEKIRFQVDKLKIKIPKFGKLLMTIYTSRFARTLCSLYTSGMSIVNALNIAKTTIGNVYIESQFDGAIKKLRNGESLSQAIKDIDGFDIKLTSSIFVGEESGRLESMLTTLADDFDFEAAERMITLIQPLMIIFLAVVIFLIIISVLLPIYTLYNNVGNM
mgnify:CR=1 FL=1